MKPFQNDVETLSLGALSIENGPAEIVIHGELVLRRDQSAMDRIDKLLELLTAIRHAIDIGRDADGALPAVVVDEIDNPFA